MSWQWRLQPLESFTAAQVAFGAEAWRLRAAEELRSALVYRALTRASREVLADFADRFAAVAREEVGHARLEAGETFDPAWAALGVIHPERRVEAFYNAIEQLVLPRLTALGIDAARAWAERYKPTSP